MKSLVVCLNEFRFVILGRRWETGFRLNRFFSGFPSVAFSRCFFSSLRVADVLWIVLSFSAFFTRGSSVLSVFSFTKLLRVSHRFK